MLSVNVEQWDEVIGDLYETVLAPSHFQAAVTKADRLLGSDLCHIVGLSNEGKENFRMFSNNALQPVGDLYAAYYHRVDPRRKQMQEARIGSTHRCSEYFDSRYVDRSEFYQDFLIPNGFRYVIGACIHRSSTDSVFVAFNHGAGRADFSDSEQTFFERYIAHLTRVMSNLFVHAPVAAALASEGALNALEVAVMAVDQHGKLVYSNRQLERMLGSVLQDEVHSGALADGGALAPLFRQVLAHGRAPTLQLRTAPGSAPVFVSAMRTRQRDDAAPVIDAYLARLQPAVVLVFSLGKNRPIAPPSELMHLFGLSAAEARLAHALGGGMAVNDYADLYCVSVATARTQLRAVLHKTGEARQQDLVRMLMALPRNPGERLT